MIIFYKLIVCKCRKVYKNKEELYLDEITVKESSKYEIISTKNVEKQCT